MAIPIKCLRVSTSPNDSASSKDVDVIEDIQMMLDKYFNGFQMRFPTKSYTTDWINLEIGIAIGCMISPILFAMAMEVII